MPAATNRPASTSVPRWRRPSAAWWFIGVVLVVRAALAALEIERPGLQYDETLFVNAATDRIPGIFIYKTWGGVPTMLMQYIGALKAWLYTPWFALVDPSPSTLRMPMVALTSVSLGLLYAGIRRAVDTRTALLAFVVLAVDASLFWLTRDDVGPTAIGFGCKALAIYGVARLLEAWKARWAVLIVVALGLGVFNKLNFVWNVNAAVVVALPLAWHYRSTLLSHRRAAAILGIGTAAIYGGFVWYAAAVDLAAQQSDRSLSVISRTWPQFRRGIDSLLSGRSFAELAAGSTQPVTVVAILVLVLAAAGLALAVLPRTRNVFVAGLGAVAILIVPQALVTEDATAPWHYIEVYPFVLICAAFAITAGAKALFKGQRGRLTALAAAAVAVVAYQGAQIADLYLRLHRGDETPIWTSAIYGLEDEFDDNGSRIFLTDWGMQNQLLALDNRAPRGNFAEEAFAIGFDTATPADLRAFADRVASQGEPIVITHGPDTEIFPASRDNTLKALAGHLQLAGRLKGPSGAVMYEVYVYRKSRVATPAGAAR